MVADAATDRRSTGARPGVAGVLGSARWRAAGCSGDAAASTTTTTTDRRRRPRPPPRRRSAAGKQFSFYVPAVGDCFDVAHRSTRPPPIYLELDCALPHQNEVFATFDYPGTKDYPGAAGARGLGQAARARPSWEAYVGQPYEISRFEIGLPAARRGRLGQRHPPRRRLPGRRPDGRPSGRLGPGHRAVAGPESVRRPREHRRAALARTAARPSCRSALAHAALERRAVGRGPAGRAPRPR